MARTSIRTYVTNETATIPNMSIFTGSPPSGFEQIDTRMYSNRTDDLTRGARLVGRRVRCGFLEHVRGVGHGPAHEL